MTFWAPLSVKEPPPMFAIDVARKVNEDLMGQCDAAIKWQGAPLVDDLHVGRRHSRRHVTTETQRSKKPLNVFDQQRPLTPSHAVAYGNARVHPKQCDSHDISAIERRKMMESIPAAPPVSQRLRSTAGLWPWQQREVALSNELVRKFVPSAPTASPMDDPKKDCVVEGTAVEGGAAPRPRQSSASPRRGASASPRRHEVKKKIMEMAARFNIPQ